MIHYEEGKWAIYFAFSLRGSVFPKAFVWSAPCALVSMGLNMFFQARPELIQSVNAGNIGASVLTGFTFILGFLVVFRSQQAYARWWEGGTMLQKLQGEWFNAYSNLIAVCNTDPAREDEVLQFQHKLVRLFSLLCCTAIEQVSSIKDQQFEIIELEGFDRDKLLWLESTHDRCEVCLQWIQRLIGDADKREIIKVAPPILSRVYNQLGNGIVNLSQARKIAEFPIPFPLAQMITFMLLFHWCITAFVCGASVERVFWSGAISFIVAFSFWSINYIAVELECPFGDDANDLPLAEMQEDINRCLVGLLDRRAQQPPDFKFRTESLKCETIPFKGDFKQVLVQPQDGQTEGHCPEFSVSYEMVAAPVQVSVDECNPAAAVSEDLLVDRGDLPTPAQALYTTAMSPLTSPRLTPRKSPRGSPRAPLRLSLSPRSSPGSNGQPDLAALQQRHSPPSLAVVAEGDERRPLTQVAESGTPCALTPRSLTPRSLTPRSSAPDPAAGETSIPAGRSGRSRGSDAESIRCVEPDQEPQGTNGVIGASAKSDCASRPHTPRRQYPAPTSTPWTENNEAATPLVLNVRTNSNGNTSLDCKKNDIKLTYV